MAAEDILVKFFVILAVLFFSSQGSESCIKDT